MAIARQSGAAESRLARALYERHHASVYRYALSQLRSREDAEDAVQNTFLRAFRALDRGVVPQNEVAWLFKIAHNVCLSSKLAWLRRRRVETPRDLDDPSLAPMSREARRDELIGLEDALAALPPRLREALLLREWQGLSYAEIAERLDTSRSAVETLIFRARRALAAELEAPARRLRQALGVGPALGWLRGLLAGGSTAVKVAGVAAVVVATAATATPLLLVKHHRPQQTQPVRTHPAGSAGGTASTPHAAVQPAPPARRRAPVTQAPSASVAAAPATPSRPAGGGSTTPAAPTSGNGAGGATTTMSTVPSVPLPAAPMLPPPPALTVPGTPTLPAPPTVTVSSQPAVPSAPPLQSAPTVTSSAPPLP